MSFVSPGFLWALSVLAIPVLIHLFSFRKTQRVYFSSNRFLRQVQQATSAKRKLKHYLILAARLLFLLFLVLAFAQPFIPATEQVSAMRSITLYVDNSMSMSVPSHDNVRALDAGINFAQQVIEVFPPDTRYQLVTNDFAPFSNSFKTKTEVTDLLTQVRLSPISRTVNEVRERITNSEGQAATDIFWISDFQKSTFGEPHAQWLTDSSQRLHLVPITRMPQANIFADTAWLESPFVVGGEKNTLHVRLRNEGTKSVEQLLLKLSINNIQAGTAMVSIPAKSTAQTSFDIVTGLSRFSRAVISFNDYPVAFDNEFYLSLNFSDKIRVLEIKSIPAATVIEKVFGNKSVFSFRSFLSGNINYSELLEADLVVLNSLDRVEPPLQQVLNDYRASGRTLLIIPSANPQLKDYQTITGIVTLKKAEDLENLELAPPDLNNPFFENVFEERNTRLALPVARRILDWGADRSALLRLKNEQPFLSRFGRTGLTYLLASPLTNEYTDFASNFLFLPVMYRMASTGKKVENKPYYLLTQPIITLRADSLAGEQPVRLAGQQEVIPPQRKVGSRLVMELPRFSMNAGFYYALHRTDTLGLLALNQSKLESLLDQYTPQAVKEKLGNGKKITIFESNTSETFSNEIKARYLGTPLWKYAILLALLFLLVEILLVRFLK
ncbi:MAG: BatA domain-containing protein [Flammeovirgaceae bacterium]|nr:MAG: BatA domain-containing protein [Flammeovirgaceae bacterium]